MISAPERCLLYYGTDHASNTGQRLSAGLLTLDFIDGGLRNICYAGHEVLRAINYVVRDKDWGTYAPEISQLKITQQTSGFSVTYAACCRDVNGQLLHYAVSIIGASTGTLRFDAHYKTATHFLTCRNGFCVLHPIGGVAGKAVTIRHTDGSNEVSVFPALIAPWQPFKDIQAISHQVIEGLQATCRLEGDVFEMEDQRNWSDASYKTYVRPLARPWPYLIPQGETGTQSVCLDMQDTAARSTISLQPVSTHHTIITVRPSTKYLPKIGLSIAPEDVETSLTNIAHLHALAPQVMLCHFDPTNGHGVEALAGFAAIANQYRGEYILECVLPGLNDPSIELTAIAAQLKTSTFKPEGIALCPAIDRQSVPPGSPWPPCPPLEQVYRAARHAFPDQRLGGGMFSYFTELNRKRPPCEQLDWITHATNPIVHAADDMSVMQTLEAIPHITRSCRAIIGADKPYWIGPITLGMRQNPYGSRTMPNLNGQRIPMASSDPRQGGLFGAAWLAGYAAQIASAGIEVFILGGLGGPRGVLESSQNAPMPDKQLRCTPIFHVIAGLAKLAGTTLLECCSSQPGKILALAGIDQLGQTSMWIANLSAVSQSCQLDGNIPNTQPLVFVLDEQGYRQISPASEKFIFPASNRHAIDRLELLPYSCINFIWTARLE